MPHLKFDVAKLDKLNDPRRLAELVPDVIWNAAACPSPRSIVEIGAGTGVFAAEFARLAPGATVYATDIEPAMVEWMAANRPEAKEGRVVPLLATETGTPLPDSSTDLVVMINLHHELAEPGATYAEAFRLLRPGGRIVVADWAPRETPKGPPLAVRANVPQLAAELEGAGFTAVREHGGLPHHSLVSATKR